MSLLERKALMSSTNFVGVKVAFWSMRAGYKKVDVIDSRGKENVWKCWSNDWHFVTANFFNVWK